MIPYTYTLDSLYAVTAQLSVVLSIYIVVGYWVFFSVKDALAKRDAVTLRRLVPSLAALAVCGLIVLLARHGYLPAPFALVQKSALIDVCQGELWWIDLWCWVAN